MIYVNNKIKSFKLIILSKLIQNLIFIFFIKLENKLNK
jgi:hypothetical protein